MPLFTPPYVFTTGNPTDNAQVNANFNAVQTVLNAIDNVNVGPGGFYASQILPTTAAQATFGGTLGYAFPASIGIGGATGPLFNAVGNETYIASGAGTTAGTVHFRTNGYSSGDTATISPTGAITAFGTIGATANPTFNSVASELTIAAAGTTVIRTSGGNLLLNSNTTTNPVQVTSGGFAVSGFATPAANQSLLGNNGGGANSNGLFRTSGTGGFFFQDSAGTVNHAAIGPSSLALTAASGTAVMMVAGQVMSLKGGTLTPLGICVPCFSAAGATVANTVHAVVQQVTAVGASTTVPIGGAATFAAATVFIQDTAAPGVLITPTSFTSTQLIFPSTNTHTYNIFMIGT